jgi:phosphoadenosine phosphosulfate reductase
LNPNPDHTYRIYQDSSMTTTATPVLLTCRSAPTHPAIPDLDRLNDRFESAHPVEIIRWAVAMFGDSLCLTTSFQDTLLVDLAVSVDPEVEVVFLDTGFHFAETLDVLRRAQARYSLHLRVERPDPDAADVWAYGQEACCKARKVDLLDRALAGKVAWLSGLRRDDSGARASAPIVGVDRRGLIKVNPMAAWPADDADAYVQDHEVIRNPLFADGYTSVGCWPCTERPAPGADPRSGRWAGSTRTECGLHL